MMTPLGRAGGSQDRVSTLEPSSVTYGDCTPVGAGGGGGGGGIEFGPVFLIYLYTECMIVYVQYI